MTPAGSCFDMAIAHQRRSQAILGGWACLFKGVTRLSRARQTDVLLQSRLALRSIVDVGEHDYEDEGNHQPSAAPTDVCEAVISPAPAGEPAAPSESSQQSRKAAMSQLLAAGVSKRVLIHATWLSFSTRLQLWSIGRIKGELLLARIRTNHAINSADPAPASGWKPRLRPSA